MRIVRTGLVVALLVGLVTIAPACATTGAPKANLVIQYRPTASSASLILSVACLGSRATAGTHPNRKAVCALLAKKGIGIFAPTPTGTACSMIYGGPETARVTGTIGSTKVKATFSKTDGCQVARWLAALPLFTFPGNAVINGAIELAPTCPGPQRIGQVCSDPSAEGTVRFTRNGKTITAIATARVGFTALLPVGSWAVTASSSRAMSCATTTIKMPLTEPLTVSCDTGIR